FNHEAYIRKCLEGFLIQQTTFDYEILIHDDCSTDNTVAIIKEFQELHPQRFKVIFQKENQYSKGVRGMVARFLVPMASGKYIAICEGDDYWTDPLKLQKQVDFLEKNENCSMVFTGCKIVKADGETKNIKYSNLNLISPGNYVLNDYYMATASLLFKKEVFLSDSEPWMSQSFAGDFVLRYRALSIGLIGCIEDITCVYHKGVANSWSNRKLTDALIVKEFSDNLRGLYFLYKRGVINSTTVHSKISRLKKSAYFKKALVKGGVSGFLFLLKNWRHTTLHFLGAYGKRMLK